MSDMLVMVPSRERPANVARFAEAAARTMSGAGEVLFIFDEDDPLLNENIASAHRPGRWPYGVRVQPRLITGPKLNFAARVYAGAYPVLMFTGDDTVPATQWWDTEILKTISAMGGAGMVYPNGLGRTDIPEHVAISSDIVRALGWFVYPGISHYYCDNVWADLGNGAGCLQLREDVVLEHHNVLYGKGPRDHVLRIAENHAAADYAAYQDWCAQHRDTDIQTVKNVTS
jgi:hypothetical protein